VYRRFAPGIRLFAQANNVLRADKMMPRTDKTASRIAETTPRTDGTLRRTTK
jgi:hypothetical protein